MVQNFSFMTSMDSLHGLRVKILCFDLIYDAKI